MSINKLLRFQPILKEKIWGGQKLVTLLNKKSDKTNIGESWEISSIQEDISVVLKGNFKGQNLRELIATYKGDLVGHKVYNTFGNTFPLLIKFIDAKEPLSVQLHPNDRLAQKRHNSFGKTEMWYVIQADKNSNVIVGFKKDTNQQDYLKHLKNKNISRILNSEKIKSGDVYLISAETIHAIGSGVLLAEIQQASDITYRIYDWDRKDSKGNYRELHIDESLNSINYKAKHPYKIKYSTVENQSSKIISNTYFTTHIVHIKKGAFLPITFTKDSFVIYICIKGSVLINHNEETELLKTGETLLIPACIKEIEIQGTQDSKILEVYI